MNKQLISVNRLKIIDNDKGKVMHALKKSESSFDEFGEVYFSNIEFNIPNQKNVIKYLRQNLNNLNIILGKYLNIAFLHLKDLDNVDIFCKKDKFNLKVKEYNKYDYVI